MTIRLNQSYDVSLSGTVLGYVGETNSRTISFQGLETQGADRYKMRIEYPDGISYEVDISEGSYTVDGSLLRQECTVKCQIQAYKTSGEEYTLVKKSGVFPLIIQSSLDGETAPIPTYEQSVEALEKVFAAEAAAETAAQNAAQSAQTAAQTAATAAETVRAAAEETLNSIPEDYTELSNNVVELKSDFNNMSVMKRYVNSGKVLFSNTDATVPAGAEIYFRPVSADESRTGLILYGMYGTDASAGYDTLFGNAPFGETGKIVAQREYHHIQVVTYPYGGTEFEFDYLQTDSCGLQPDVSNLQSDVSDLKSDMSKLSEKINTVQSIAANGHHSAKGSSVVLDFDGIELGATYKIYAWNIVGGNSIKEPLLYLFKTDGTYISITNSTERELLNNSIVYTVTVTDEDSAYLRLYMNKSPDAQLASCDYAFVKIVGTRLDAIEEKISNVISNVEEKIKNNCVSIQSLLNRTTCKIFKRVVCCGDSYTSGHIQLAGETQVPTNEEFAWPHYMSTLTGNDWINCGCSGCNVLTWQTHSRGLPAAQAQGKVQAYVIGLMINDVSNSTRAVELGTVDDIGTDAQTYYGGMSAIIRELNTISPQAKIFVNTCPKTGEKYTRYNQAVRDIVNAYKDTYPVHCIDLEASKELYTNASLTADSVSGHYTAVGYEQFAEIYSYILSKYINENVSEFQDVYRIEYDG
ncbi:MAG: SGNH/GDSL hydrolase family protein [Oscillospiraceae bacterium]